MERMKPKPNKRTLYDCIDIELKSHSKKNKREHHGVLCINSAQIECEYNSQGKSRRRKTNQ